MPRKVIAKKSGLVCSGGGVGWDVAHFCGDAKLIGEDASMF